jgi:hypothetical protein
MVEDHKISKQFVLNVTNVVMVQHFGILLYTFNVVGICTNVN